MYISDYQILVNEKEDRIIYFRHNRVKRRIIIKKNDVLQIKIFEKYYNLLRTIKNRQYIVAKWIIRDIILEDYHFEHFENKLNSFCLRKNNIMYGSNTKTSKAVLFDLLVELNLENI